MKRPTSGWAFEGNTTKPGNPLWDEYRQVDYDEKGRIIGKGRSTLEEHTPTAIPVCREDDHVFHLLDNNGNVQCQYCPVGKRIVWGKEVLVEGKVVRKQPPKSA